MVWPWLPTAATGRLPYTDSVFVKLPTHQDFFVSPRSVLVAFPWLFMDTYRRAENMGHPTGMLPPEMVRGQALSSCGSSHTVRKSRQGIFRATFLFL